MSKTSPQEFAEKYLADMLTFFGLNLEVHATTNDGVVNLSVPSSDANGFLIGERGGTLRSMQHVVNLALNNAGFEDARVTVDIADYKKQKWDRLAEQVRQWGSVVAATGTPMELNSMSAAERRIVHKTVGEIDGLATESQGEGRDRHVVIRKAD